MPDPVLARVERAHTRNAGYCGAFTYIDDWTLANPKPGAIIQKITRTLTGLVMVNGGIDLPMTVAEAATAFDVDKKKPMCLDTMVYWELFRLKADGTLDGDQFQTNWFAKTNADGSPSATTRGTYTIHGEAKFYVTALTDAQLGFTGKLPVAANLPSTITDPSAHLAGLTASNLVTRTVVASWDSAKVDKATNSHGVTQLTVT
jgi:hypothetical protein